MCRKSSFVIAIGASQMLLSSATFIWISFRLQQEPHHVPLLLPSIHWKRILMEMAAPREGKIRCFYNTFPWSQHALFRPDKGDNLREVVMLFSH